jgi:uncharacterized protein YciW
VINESPLFTPEQKIAIAVYRTVLWEQQERIEKYAQRLRDAVDVADE